jgi:chaperonin GroES
MNVLALSHHECQSSVLPQFDSQRLPPDARASFPLELNNMNFRPLHDRVVIKRADSETKTTGGIIIPDTAGEKPQQGDVIAVGPGGRDEAGKLIPIDIKKGDKVLFGKWSGTEVKIDGEELLIMKESDIMGVLDK